MTLSEAAWQVIFYVVMLYVVYVAAFIYILMHHNLAVIHLSLI